MQPHGYCVLDYRRTLLEVDTSTLLYRESVKFLSNTMDICGYSYYLSVNQERVNSVDFLTDAST